MRVEVVEIDCALAVLAITPSKNSVYVMALKAVVEVPNWNLIVPAAAAVPVSRMPMATNVRDEPDVLRTAQGVVVAVVIVTTALLGRSVPVTAPVTATAPVRVEAPVTVSVPSTAKSSVNSPAVQTVVLSAEAVPKDFSPAGAVAM